MNIEVTFLKEEQIWGSSAIGVMKDSSYGTKTGFSDLAIVLGGLMGSRKTSDGQRTGYVWSASSGGGGYVRTVNDDGGRYGDGPDRRGEGARPALPSSMTSKIQPSEARLTRKIGAVEVKEYGEYPQTIAPENVKKDLEQAFSRNQLETTGKKYTFDAEKYDAYDKPFKAKEYPEYQHNGKRYIRVEAQPRDGDSVLSTGRRPEAREICWIEVQPIEWLVDPSGVWVARQVLFSGVQFDSKKSYEGNFDKTDMKKYLDTYFAKEMVTARGAEINEEKPKSAAPSIKPIEIHPTAESVARDILARFGDQITREQLLKVGRDKKTVLRKAIEGGLLGEALKMLEAAGEKITKNDLITNEPGAPNSNIEQIAAQGQLPTLFTPENMIGNLGEMMECIEYLRMTAPKSLNQLDGQEGRPSFKRILQEANSASLKALQTGTRVVGGE